MIFFDGRPKFFERDDLESVAILVLDGLGRLEIAKKLRETIWADKSLAEVLELVIAGVKWSAKEGYFGKATNDAKGSRWMK